MSNILLETKNVGKIKGLFYLPNYQRGYRWTSEEITAVAAKHKIEIFDDTHGIFDNMSAKYLVITPAIVEELKNYIK